MTSRRERRIRDQLKQLLAELDAPPSTQREVPLVEPPLPSQAELDAWATRALAGKGRYRGDPFR